MSGYKMVLKCLRVAGTRTKCLYRKATHSIGV